ncbi:acetyl-CoA carboxylase biotin carboxyl carrier protein [Clostridium oceanicum]|uniref:Biotin carboxyl carrier protein of acetyl-CoA carboxylase n=1 Tax=Clostridium oceanicum TaxID=1543 RepID=A0ABP3UZ83_9CLOT
MEFKAIEGIINAMSKSNLSSLDIEAEGISIKMKKENNVVYKEVKNLEGNSIENNNISEINKVAYKKDKEVDENLTSVKSPIVGTFYESPGAGKDPYVKVGDKVKKGDVLCIVEAMKVMNEIEAETDGEIAEISVKNEDMVEYGQELFKIR